MKMKRNQSLRKQNKLRKRRRAKEDQTREYIRYICVDNWEYDESNLQ